MLESGALLPDSFREVPNAVLVVSSKIIFQGVNYFLYIHGFAHAGQHLVAVLCQMHIWLALHKKELKIKMSS